MKKLIIGGLFSALTFAASVAQATLIEISTNSSVTPGVKAFVPNGSSGFPTPFYNVSNAPAAQNYFNLSDTIRVAIQLDLDVVDASTDDLGGVDIGGFLGSQLLNWTYAFDSLDNPLLSFTGDVGYTWAAITNAQANPNLHQINFVSNPFSGLAEGDWKVTSYLEGVEYSNTQFHVPEPGTFALLGLGLLMAGRRKFKKN